MKQEVRLLGIDDGAFQFSDTQCLIVGALTRGKHYLEAVFSQYITVDGFDSTDAIIKMVFSNQQIRAILTDGITFGGCNVLDIQRIHEETGVGIIAVTRKQPDTEEMKAVMRKLPYFDERWQLVQKAGTPITAQSQNIVYQSAGLSPEKTRHILRLTTEGSNVPEPVRIAHLIASGLTKGESRGRV